MRCRRRPGCAAAPATSFPQARYADRKGRPKRVRYWSMEPIDGEFVPNDEVDEVRWLSLHEAAELLSYAHDRTVLAALPDPSPVS